MSSIIKVATVILACAALVYGCGGNKLPPAPATAERNTAGDYLIGPGDSLQIFVWRNPEFSVTLPVRPDGRISTPLVEDTVAVGKTPTELARELEQTLSSYVRNPVVTVIVRNFVGSYTQQVRIIGAATTPKAIPYRDGMTLLDVLLAVGGTTDKASGNRATIVRNTPEGQQNFRVRIEDLMKEGDITANVAIEPGDVLVIPESFF